MSNKLVPSYKGYVGSTKDALLIIQGILNKQLDLIPRRPHERERADLIKSGNVFIFIEEHSGIKRWTDGISWSPSRILGRFLVYRELDKEMENASIAAGSMMQDATQRKKKKRLSEDFEINNTQHGFKDHGLIKKTLLITTNLKELNVKGKAEKQTIHLISYYNANDVVEGKLSRPCEGDLRNVSINNYLWNVIKDSNLGGKIKLEDEAFYFLDNNYQLQNMSTLGGASHGGMATGAAAGVPSGMTIGSTGSVVGTIPSGIRGGASQQVPPLFYPNKQNYMLPMPPNHEYYKRDDEDVTFVNPFTTGNFNISSNLNSFYHDVAPSSQSAAATNMPQTPTQAQVGQGQLSLGSVISNYVPYQQYYHPYHNSVSTANSDFSNTGNSIASLKSSYSGSYSSKRFKMDDPLYHMDDSHFIANQNY